MANGRRASSLSNQTRTASSAVWTIHPIGEVRELKLTWTKDNGSESITPSFDMIDRLKPLPSAPVRMKLGHVPAINDRLSARVVDGANVNRICETELVTAWRKQDVKLLKDFRALVSLSASARHQGIGYLTFLPVIRGCFLFRGKRSLWTVLWIVSYYCRICTIYRCFKLYTARRLFE